MEHPAGRGSLPLRYRHLDGFRATAAQDFRCNCFANRLAVKRREEIVGVANRLAADTNQDITDQ
jgi:hypothetical protein